VDQEKREIRQLKREVKRAGNKHQRRNLKRSLTEDPEEAHRAEVDYGRYRSDAYNGLDRDATRRTSKAPDRQQPE
jgi:hypothetical protein